MQAFPLEISLHDIFFFKSPIISSKVKLPAAKVHPNIGSVDRLRFVNNYLLKQYGTKFSRGEGEEFVSTYPFPESPYGRKVTDSSPFSINYAAPRSRPSRTGRLRYYPWCSARCSQIVEMFFMEVFFHPYRPRFGKIF